MESWNTRLDKQAGIFIDLASKVKQTDQVLLTYFDALSSLEKTITDMQSKQNVYKEEFLNIQRHQDEMMNLLDVGMKGDFDQVVVRERIRWREWPKTRYRGRKESGYL